MLRKLSLLHFQPFDWHETDFFSFFGTKLGPNLDQVNVGHTESRVL